MTVSLKWLLDGIAAVPDSDAQIVDLAIDSRDVRAGSLFLALCGTKSHGLEHAADAAARGASAVLWEPAAGVEPPVLRRTALRRAGPESTPAGRPYRRPLLPVALLADAHRRHHGHERQDHLRLPDHAVPGAPGSPRRLYGHARLGTSRAARDTHAHDARCGERAPLARAPEVARREGGCHGGVLARARSRPRGRRALSFRGVHQLEPRSSRLPRLDAGVRGGQGAAVQRAGSRAGHHQRRRSVRARARAQAGGRRAA